MNRINVNGQNGVATSAVNVEVFYITYNGVKKVVNAFESVEERREIIEIISEAVAFGKKDFYLYYKIGDFVGCFSIDKDYKGNYVLCYGSGQVNLWFSRLSGAKNFNTLESEIYNAIREMVFKMSEQVVEQEQDDAAIEYLREVMPVIPVDIISEKIDECVADLCLVENDKTMDFDKFCDVLWDDYVWDEVFTDEALESDTREWMEFNDRVRYIIENEKENIFINYDDEIVGEIAPKNDTPCLVDGVYYVNSEYDIDGGIERVADTIEKYLGSYTPSYLDSFGDCTITIYWDEFNEQDMKMLIENNIFSLAVRDTLYERGVIENLSGFLVYDDGVYVDVDYDKTFNKSNVLNTLRREYALCDDDVYEMPINTLADRCGGYHVNAPIYVMYDKENDNYYVNGTSDDDSINDELTSKTTYMELYDMITETINVADTIENALDEAMESDDEYYDDVICQIGKWYVNYTSPCDEFPDGCVLVVDERGCMYGNWCDVSDVDFAVEYLVNTIEMCNKEFNNVA